MWQIAAVQFSPRSSATTTTPPVPQLTCDDPAFAAGLPGALLAPVAAPRSGGVLRRLCRGAVVRGAAHVDRAHGPAAAGGRHEPDAPPTVPCKAQPLNQPIVPGPGTGDGGRAGHMRGCPAGGRGPADHRPAGPRRYAGDCSRPGTGRRPRAGSGQLRGLQPAGPAPPHDPVQAHALLPAAGQAGTRTKHPGPPPCPEPAAGAFAGPEGRPDRGRGIREGGGRPGPLSLHARMDAHGLERGAGDGTAARAELRGGTGPLQPAT